MASSAAPGEKRVIVVVGAGLAGCMTALYLARRQSGGRPLYQVHVFEKRGDFRARELATDTSDAYGAATDAVKRSINLALSVRGQEALAGVGLLETVMSTSVVPMYGRVIHDKSGTLSFQPYGKKDQHINSVARDTLTRLLLGELDKCANVRTRFNRKLQSARKDGSVAFVESDDDGRDVREGETLKLTADLVIGADGAFSRVRDAMLRGSRVDFSRTFIKHSYKEFHIAPAAGGKGFRLEQPEGLHIWPRHEFMLIALPNPDFTFTCTLFAPNTTFDDLDASVAAGRPGDVVSFFRENFPDALELLGEAEVLSQYAENPTGSLVTVRVRPWRQGRMLLIGDAAHAVVPFFGQGMNAAFEDALELNASLDAAVDDVDAALDDFTARREPTGAGLADLSLENYEEMRSHTASPLFVLSKQIEAMLHAVAPAWWVPRYTMVSFTRTPYHVARDTAHRQEAALSVAGGAVAAAAAAGLAAGAIAVARDAQDGFRQARSLLSSAQAALGLA